MTSLDLPALLLNASKRFSNQSALQHPGGKRSYLQMQKAALALANRLDFKQRPFQIVAGEQTLDEYIQIWASWISGKPYLPLNPKFPAQRQHTMLEITKRFFELSSQSTSEAHKPIKPDPLAYLIFTSGSTGNPKGIPITQTQLARYCQILQGILQANASDRVLQLGDLSFDISIMAMAIAWPNGAELCVVPTQHVLMAPRYAADLNITIWLSVPSVIHLAAQAGLLAPNSLPQLRLAIFGGEALSYESAKVFSAAAPNARLVNFWGPSEGTISLSHFEIDRALLESPSPPNPDLATLPLGFPHADVELALWDSEQQNWNAKEGELCVSSAQLTLTYLENPQPSAQAFFTQAQKRWYRTGDLARWHDQYGYCYRGRLDRQIKLKGYRIELQECEQALRQASGCDAVAIVPFKPNANPANPSLIGFLGKPVPLQLAQEQDAIFQKLRTLLPNYMIPQQLIFLDFLPLNPSGKIDFNALELKAYELVS
jgi:acyl-coenzyme A synthetase/AMP-(fatty) acid ligase